MKGLRWIALIAAAAVATIAAPADARTADRAGLQQALDQIVASGATGALAEVRGGHNLWLGSSGVAEVGNARPVPARGLFRAGSVTKAFVATVILQLVAEGPLQLDDTVESWLPRLVPHDDRITIRQLLSHTSGVDDYLKTLPLNPPAGFLPLRWRTWSPLELVERATSLPPLSEPGAEYHYSNTNSILLGLVIEKVTQRPYAAEVEERIIRPLQLTGTSVPGTDVSIREPHAHGYLPVEEAGQLQLVDITEMNPSVMGASGEILSTAKNLNRFFAALLAGRLIPSAELQDMTAARPTGTPRRNYGLGLVRLDLPCGVSAYGHDGDALGYSTWSFTTEQRQVTLSITWGTTRKPNAAVTEFLKRSLCP